MALIAVDSSAVLACFFAEDDGENYFRALMAAERRYISAVSRFEAFTVALSRTNEAGATRLLDFLDGAGLETVPFDAAQAASAADAYRRYGKGRGHRAQLNLGDCAAYALARHLGAPLLFKGGDFAKTDIAVAAPA